MTLVCRVMLNGLEEELVSELAFMDSGEVLIYDHQVLWTDNGLLICEDAAV